MVDQYSHTTRDITITVQPIYLDEESSVTESQHVWAYHVRIDNQGDEVVQLINRYWHITDGRGMVKEVKGPGVVGQQPLIRPGEIYEYASGVPLNTQTGIMKGHYEMQLVEGGSAGSMFNAIIPTFSLDSAEQLERPN